MGSYPRLIGLTGLARSGKDTTGRILIEQYDYQRFGFADAVKSMALALNPYIPAQSFGELEAGLSQGLHRLADFVAELGWEDAKSNPEVRRFLQVLGTEGVRAHFGDEAWVDLLKEQLVTYDNDPMMTSGGFEWNQERAVITDVRFPNEADAVHRLGGVMWRVERPGVEEGTHASEALVNSLEVDMIIRNNGTIEDLVQHVKMVMEHE